MDKNRDAHVHDRMFKMIMSHVEYVIEILQQLLPSDMHEHLRSDRLTMMSSEFTRYGKSRHADVIYRLQLDEAGSVYLYFIFEHKSYPDKGLHKQLLQYLLDVLEKYDPQLPVVVVVWYHGTRPWPRSQHGTARRRFPSGIRVRGTYDFGLDYHSIGPQNNHNPFLHGGVALRAYGEMAMTIWWMEDRDYLRGYVQRVLGPLSRIDRRMYRILLEYVMGYVRGLKLDELDEMLVEYADMEEQGMAQTILEEAIETGEAKGRVEGERLGIEKGERRGIDKGERRGIEKGRVEGRTEERTEVAQRMLRMDFNSDVVHKATGLSASEIETLRHSLNGSQR